MKELTVNLWVFYGQFLKTCGSFENHAWFLWVFEQRVFETAPIPCRVSQWLVNLVTMVLKNLIPAFDINL
jgi:hypothetical protein